MRHQMDIFDAQRMIFADPTILNEVQAKIEEAAPERGCRMACESFLATRPTRKRRTIPTFRREQRIFAKWNELF